MPLRFAPRLCTSTCDLCWSVATRRSARPLHSALTCSMGRAEETYTVIAPRHPQAARAMVATGSLGQKNGVKVGG